MKPHTVSNDKHINLLTDAEVEELYSRPKFNKAERDYYFLLSDKEHQSLSQYRNLKSKLYFILHLGYFKASKQFYKFSIEMVQADVTYLIEKYFSPTQKPPSGTLWKESYRQQKLEILSLCQYHEWSTEFIPKALGHLKKLIRLYPKGNDTLRELFVFLENQRITIPSYRTLQNLFTQVFKEEKERLDGVMLKIPKHLQLNLESLIKNDNGLSQLNIIRMDQKDFKYSAISDEVKKVALLRELYQLSKTIIPSLDISDNAVRYYALLAEQYSASRIRRLAKPQQWLYLLCFTFHRYQEFMDNLIISFMAHMRSLIDDAKAYVKIKEAEYINSITMDFPLLVEFLKWFSSEDINSSMTQEAFKKMGFDILPREKQTIMADFIAGIAFDRQTAEWEYYEKSSRRMALYLRPILIAVDFESSKPSSLIMKLIHHLRNYYQSGKSPKHLIDSFTEEEIEKIPQRDLALLQGEDEPSNIHPARLEYYLYKKMHHQLDRGWLFCNNSVSYCSLDDDLVPDELVNQANEISKKFGYEKIPIYCDERLEQALAELESSWEQTNQHIDGGYNTGIKINIDDEGISTWQLSYDTEKAEEPTFFDGLSQIDIADIMKFIGDQLNIWPAFKSLKYRYIKHKQPDPLALIACSLADAFGFGVKKMSAMSNVSYNYLRTIDENFMHIENLNNTNDVTSNYIHGLPISRAWDLEDNLIIADADGQKFETRQQTIQSRYSSKYFGTYKGISVYSLVANHIPINSKIIGPNEHESHHLYDILYNNHSDVVIDKVTGDNHSINQANYVALDSINITFIPGIKDIHKAAKNLYSVNDPHHYSGLIKPIGKIKVELIRSEKRGITRILLSLLLQKNTQAVIIRKLSSHKRYSRLRAALWEYNKIFKSTHVLNVIDSMQLRKVIKTARNRTESYHQLQRTIRKIYSGVFKGKRIVDNAISNQASRFVANCIIAYNATLLNQLYQRLISRVGEEKAKTAVCKISPVAWQYIIFTGRYHFKNKVGGLELENFVEILEQKLDEIMLLKSD